MSPKKILSREDILSAKDIETEEVFVKEWGGTVFVRGMTGAQRDQFERDTMDMSSSGRKGLRVVKYKLQNARARLACICTVDKEGKHLFTPEDIAQLEKKNAKPLDRIYDVAQRLSGITDEDLEELVKNSESDQS